MYLYAIQAKPKPRKSPVRRGHVEEAAASAPSLEVVGQPAIQSVALVDTPSMPMSLAADQTLTSCATPGLPLRTRALRVPADHIYAVQESPRTLKRKLDLFVEKDSAARSKIKKLQQNISRLKRTVSSLSIVVECLKHEQLISNSCVDMLEKTFSGVPLLLMKRIMSHKGKQISRAAYPAELRAFVK
jgi:hypothetical protein